MALATATHGQSKPALIRARSRGSSTSPWSACLKQERRFMAKPEPLLLFTPGVSSGWGQSLQIVARRKSFHVCDALKADAKSEPWRLSRDAPGTSAALPIALGPRRRRFGVVGHTPASGSAQTVPMRSGLR